jgi:hypothetical protein
MVGKMSMSLDLEILLKFSNVGREPGSFIIYLFLHSFYLFFLFSSYFSLYIYIGNVYLPHSVLNIIQHIDGGQPEPPELPKSSPSLVVVKSDMQP